MYSLLEHSVKKTLLFVLFAASLCTGGGYAQSFDLTDHANRVLVEIAIGCKQSQDVNDPGVYAWSGKVFSRRTGEADRHLFDVQGVNPRACRIYDDPVRGPGYLASARELMIYLDPKTGELLDQWTNPWTGEQVDVIHMVNDPASMSKALYAYNADGTPTPKRRVWEDWGENIINRRPRAFYRENPLGGDYQEWVGGKYQAFENSAIRIHKSHIDSILKGERVPYNATWVRVSQWLPWMGMGSREGMIIIATEGRSFDSVDDVPEPIAGLIKTRWPLMQRVPDFDDDRPFSSSWDSLKKEIDAQRKAGD
jgi:hypothetical protein